MSYVKIGGVIALLFTLWLGYQFIVGVIDDNKQLEKDNMVQQISIARKDAEIKYQKELSNYVQKNNEKFLVVMSDTRKEREKGKAVLSDSARLGKLASARPSRLTGMANRAGVKLWTQFEALSRNGSTAEPVSASSAR